MAIFDTSCSIQLLNCLLQVLQQVRLLLFPPHIVFSSTGYTNYTISLANVAATTLTSSFLTSSLTQVYTSSLYAASGNNNFCVWYRCRFSLKLYMNGTSNILVNICYTVSGASSSSDIETTTTSGFTGNLSYLQLRVHVQLHQVLHLQTGLMQHLLTMHWLHILYNGWMVLHNWLHKLLQRLRQRALPCSENHISSYNKDK